MSPIARLTYYIFEPITDADRESEPIRGAGQVTGGDRTDLHTVSHFVPVFVLIEDFRGEER